jgi:hypothetical protein
MHKDLKTSQARSLEGVGLAERHFSTQRFIGCLVSSCPQPKISTSCYEEHWVGRFFCRRCMLALHILQVTDSLSQIAVSSQAQWAAKVSTFTRTKLLTTFASSSHSKLNFLRERAYISNIDILYNSSMWLAMLFVPLWRVASFVHRLPCLHHLTPGSQAASLSRAKRYGTEILGIARLLDGS